MYVEANGPSLYSHREKLSLQYDIRLPANRINPAHAVSFPRTYVDLYETKSTAIKSSGIRISPILESANMKPQTIKAWCLKQPEILFFTLPLQKALNQTHTY